MLKTGQGGAEPGGGKEGAGAPEPLYRGCPTVIGRSLPGQACVSLVRTNEDPPTAHLPLVEGTRLSWPSLGDGEEETEVRGSLATKIVPAYVAANDGLDEQLFLANEGQDWKEAKTALLRVLEKASARAWVGMHEVM